MRGPFGGGGGGGRGPGLVHSGKPKDTKKTLKMMFHYLKPFTWQLIVVALFVIIAAAANIAGTYMMKPLLEGVLDEDVTLSVAEKIAELIEFSIIMGSIYIAGTACQYGYSRIMVGVSSKILRDIRKEVFFHMEELPIRFFDRRSHGDIMSVYSNDVDSLRELLSRALPQLISSFVTIIGFLTAMILLNPLLIIVGFIQVGVNIVIIQIIGKRSRRNYSAQQKALADINGEVEEIVEGQKVVKVFNHEKYAKEKFDELNIKLQLSATKANTYANFLMPVMGSTAHIFYAITIVLGALMVIANNMGAPVLGIVFTIPSFVTYLEYSRRFSMPITNISQQFNSIFHGLAGSERIFNLLEEKKEVDEGTVTLCNAYEDENKNLVQTSEKTGVWAWKVPQQEGEQKLVKLQGEVVFEKVTFGYDEDKTVLHGVSLYAHKGQKIAFVGATGAGKTTITNLINRFYDVPDGKIKYDGININDIKKDDLRRSLSMVLQDTHLFTGTVMENIRYGNLDATDEQCIAAAKLANAHFFISHLPDKYDTMLVSDGANLSQGQRQLISIARAAVADPPVLILDEATSSIDTRTESHIERGMDSLMEGRTVFVIAHRLSTVKNADAILVLDKGKIIERGNHTSLLDKKGKYYELYTGMLELE